MPKKTVVWAKMGLVICLFHLAALGLFFTGNQHGAHIQFMVPAHTGAEMPIVFVTTAPSPVTKQIATSSVAAQPSRAPKQSTACAVQEKKMVHKEVKKKEEIAKNSNKAPAKKVEQAHVKPKQKELLTKNNVKKDGVKKTLASQHMAQAAEKQAEPIAIELSKDARHLVDEYQQLYTLLQERWAPPDGMQACSCVIQCTVGWDGAIQKLEIMESSGTLMFDLSARNTVGQLTLPKWTKGKSIAITFVA